MAWQDRARNLAHLNWTSAYEPEYEYAGSPLDCIAWEVSRLPGGGSLLMIDYLDRFWGSPHSFADLAPIVNRPIVTALSPDELRDLNALKKLTNGLVVMRVIVVHCDIKTVAGTDLFGLLGDARVQIVDVADEARIEAFFAPAESSERKSSVTIGQDFGRESANSMRQKLRAVIIAQFCSEELAAAMRPAVRFRLCTRMCNNIKDKRVEVDLNPIEADPNAKGVKASDEETFAVQKQEAMFLD